MADGPNSKDQTLKMADQTLKMADGPNSKDGGRSSHTLIRTASHWRMKVRSWGAKFCALTNDIVSYFNATGLFVESETFIIPSHPIYISRIYESNIASRDFDSVSMPTENFRIDDQMSIRRD